MQDKTNLMTISPEVQKEAERLAENCAVFATEKLASKKRDRPWEDIAQDIDDAILPFLKKALQSAHEAAKAGWQQQRAELIDTLKRLLSKEMVHHREKWPEVIQAGNVLAKLDSTQQDAEATPRVESGDVALVRKTLNTTQPRKCERLLALAAFERIIGTPQPQEGMGEKDE